MDELSHVSVKVDTLFYCFNSSIMCVKLCKIVFTIADLTVIV